MKNFRWYAGCSRFHFLKFRRLSGFVPLGIYACFVASVVIGLGNVESRASGAESLDEVLAMWQQWESTVNTLEIQGLKIQLALNTPENVYTRDEFMSFLTEKLVPEVKRMGSSVEQNSLSQLLPPIYHLKFDQAKPSNPLGSLRPYSLVEDNGKIRVDEVLDGQAITTIRADMKDTQYIASTFQADVYTSHTNYKVEDHDFFLYQLPFVVEGAFESSDLANNRFRIEAELSSSEVDAETGFVTRHSQRRSNGNLLYERLQYLPFFPDAEGTPIPRVLVEARYFDQPNTLFLIEIYVCANAFVNREISDDRFVLGVPAGTRVVDHSVVDRVRTQRDGAERYAVNVPKQDIKNVEEYAKDSSE